MIMIRDLKDPNELDSEYIGTILVWWYLRSNQNT